MKESTRTLTDALLPEIPETRIWAEGTPALLHVRSLLDLFNWYKQNLCGRVFIDPRGYRVTFLDTDFVHLIKLTDRYGKEPKNRRMAIEQIQSERIRLIIPGRFSLQRAQELCWARSIIENPAMIVPNWQVMGRANPGDAYIKNFGLPEKPIYRVLICGHSGLRRWAVTIFPKERVTEKDLAGGILWPKNEGAAQGGPL